MKQKNNILVFGLVVIVVIALSSCLPPPDMGDPQDPEPNPIEPGIGLLGSYFDSTTGQRIHVRNDSQLNFFWATGNSPYSSVPHDYFSVVWEGQIRAPETQNYILSVRVDDGVRVFIDNQLLIESWQNQGGSEGQEPLYHSNIIHLSATELKNIRIEYYEANWTAAIRLYWKKEGESESSMTIIPTEYLYPAIDATSEMPEGAVKAPDTETPNNPPDDNPSDSEYGARDVPRSKTPSSTDVYVSPSGTGTTCSLTNPCSLNEGLKKNGFIWLLDGTYNYEGQLSLNDGKTLEAYTPKKAIIDFRNTAGSRMTLGHNNIVRNIVVRNAAQTGIMVFGNNNLLEGIISEYNFGSGFQTWPSSGYTNTKSPTGGSYNNFTDSIGRFNNDCPSTTCNDSGADGISVSAGRGNRIIRFTAYANSDDGIDIWASYETLIQNSNSYDNGFDSVGNQIGNGMQYKMGSTNEISGYTPVPNNHRIINNWAHGKHIGLFSRNGGEGFAEISGNVCYDNKESC